jgi:N-acetylmuramoyl-L-alanine amidase
MKIIIDPGHGGDDPGVIDEVTGLSEKYANLVTALTLKHYLAKSGAQVEMTRVNDARPAFSERSKNRGANLLLSIHYDWNKGRSLIYYASESPSRVKDKELALNLSSLLSIPAMATVQSPHGRLFIDDYKEGRAILWEVDKIGNFQPTERYRIEKCLDFVNALKVCLR